MVTRTPFFLVVTVALVVALAEIVILYGEPLTCYGTSGPDLIKGPDSGAKQARDLASELERRLDEGKDAERERHPAQRAEFLKFSRRSTVATRDRSTFPRLVCGDVRRRAGEAEHEKDGPPKGPAS
jgi:hypothetical protein